jgi:chaperone modulatory protein CbpM
MAYPLVCAAPARTSLEAMSLKAFAGTAGVHPELLRRLVRLGVLDPYVDAVGRLWFPPAQLTRLARAQRLRAALGLNYSALGLVLDLLNRIDVLEAALRARRTQEWS